MSSSKQISTPPCYQPSHDMDSPEICPKVYGLANDVEHQKHGNPIQNAAPRQFTLFENQVAGTLPMLHADGMLYKPLKTEMERTFYKNIVKWIPEIGPFIPGYSGMEHIKINVEEESDSNYCKPHALKSNSSSPSPLVPLSSNASSTDLHEYHPNYHHHNNNNNHNNHDHDPNPHSHSNSNHNHSHYLQSQTHSLSVSKSQTPSLMNNPWSTRMFEKNKHRIAKTPFLILEDVTGSFHKPCILDLKIGTRHFAPICKDRKMHRKLRKAWCSTCKHFGVRIGGIQRFDVEQQTNYNMTKDVAMRLDRNAFITEICGYFQRVPHPKMLHQFISKLQKLYNVLKEECRFRWFSCSLLFVYEAQTEINVNIDRIISTNTSSHSVHSQNPLIQTHDVNHAVNQRQRGSNTNANTEDNNTCDDGDSSVDDEMMNMNDDDDVLSESMASDIADIELNIDEEQTAVSIGSDSEGMRLDLRLIDFTNFVIVEDHLDALRQGDNTDSGDLENDEIDDVDTDGIVVPMLDSDDSNGSKEDVMDGEEDEDKHESQSTSGPTTSATKQGTEESIDRDRERLQLCKELDSLEEPDHGILFGLESLIKLLSELQSTGTIKRRTDEEWDAFTESLQFMEMALFPFSDRKMFNENTTIH